MQKALILQFHLLVVERTKYLSPMLFNKVIRYLTLTYKRTREIGLDSNRVCGVNGTDWLIHNIPS